MIGQTIAHYTITEKIGQGGMGEVYRATDTKLKRDVALKILPENFAQDPQRMGRFQREAEVLASLNHPNIAGIHGLEQEGSTHAIAMELVEGETLAARISKGAIPLEETLKIALQIAEALEAAHEKGIIHRDLKPANVIVTPEGIVKVLDFGLAKAMEPAASSEGDLSQSPTLTMQATQAGIIMGTAAYMSPEQAKGLIADQRSDIWSFGAVSFEMLAGKQPFAGEDITEVLASVVKVDMNWDALPSDVPATVQKWLKRCLRSDPKQRCQAIGDIRLDIQDTLDNPEAESASTVLQPPPPVFWKAPTVWMTVAVTVALTVLVTWFLKPTPLVPERPVFRTTIAPARLDTSRINPHVISPDGRVLVYGAAGSLWIRYLDRFYPDPLPDSENTRYAFFSLDSRFLGYGQSGKLWKVHLANGVKSPVCDIPNNYAGATWGTDGSIVFGTFGGGLYQVSDQGGDPRLIVEPDPDRGEAGFAWPHFLPDQRGIIFSAFRTGYNTIELLIEGNLTTLLSQEDAAFWSPVYSPSGHLIYRRTQSNEGLFAVSFSLSSLEISGDPFRIVANVSWPSVSRDLTLIYRINAFGGLRELVRVDRTGQVITTLGQPQRIMQGPALSPDGDWVAISAAQDDNRDIWLYDVQRGSGRRLSFSNAPDLYPAWTAAGDEIAFFQPEVEEIWIRPADSSRDARKLTDGRRPHFSADGRFLVFERDSPETGVDLWYLEVGQDTAPIPFLVTEHDESRPRLSPDSRWIAYRSDDSGQLQIYVKNFPSGEGLWQISTGRGEAPRWSPDGDELFYLQDQDLMVVSIQGTSSLDHGSPTRLFSHPARYSYAVGEGGESFILPRTAGGDETPPAIAIVQNWFSEFRNRQ